MELPQGLSFSKYQQFSNSVPVHFQKVSIRFSPSPACFATGVAPSLTELIPQVLLYSLSSRLQVFFHHAYAFPHLRLHAEQTLSADAIALSDIAPLLPWESSICNSTLSVPADADDMAGPAHRR